MTSRRALLGLCILAAFGVMAAAQDVPAPALAPAPAAANCSGLYTANSTWLVVTFSLTNLTSSQLTADAFTQLTMIAADQILQSMTASTGIQPGLLQDVVASGDSTVRVAVQLTSSPSSAQQAALQMWLAMVASQSSSNSAADVSQGSAPSLGAPAPPAPAASQNGSGAVINVQSYNVSSCLPQDFAKLIRTVTAQPSTLGSGASSADASPNCTRTGTYYAFVSYVLVNISDVRADETALNGSSGSDILGPAGVSQAGVKPPPSSLRPQSLADLIPNGSVGTTDVAAASANVSSDVLKSLWLSVQRSLAINVAPYVSSPYGPMWANGTVGAFALPLDLSAGTAPAGVGVDLTVYSGNITADADVTRVTVLQCLPAYFNETNDLTGLQLWDTQGCPLNASGSLELPPLSDTPQWFANLNATLNITNSSTTAAGVRQAVADVNALAVELLSNVLDSGRRNYSFVWPRKAVDGELKASGQVSLLRAPDNQTFAHAEADSAAYANNSGKGFPWGTVDFSPVDFTPCSPLWFDTGYRLAAELNQTGPLVPVTNSNRSSNSSSTNSTGTGTGTDGGSSTPVGAIVGGVLGGLALVALLLAGFVWRSRRQRTAALANTSAMLRGRAGLDDAWLIPYEDIKLIERLGGGGYGTVYRARWKETKVAVKCFSTPTSTQPSNGSSIAAVTPPRGKLEAAVAQTVVESLQKEAAIMSSIRHPNCILYLGAVLDPPCLVMELASKGSLLEVLQKAKEPLPWVRRVNMAFDAAKGMQYLHSRQPAIIHRDLKSPNLLVDAHWHVKVSDFGLSRALQEQGSATSSLGGPGNPRWLAPEVLKGEDHVAASDVYAFGIMLWEILQQGSLPWDNMGAWKIAAVVTAGERPPIPPREECPAFVAYDEYVNLMTDCWQQDPAARPTFDDICARLRAILEALVKQLKGRSSQLDRPPSFTQRLRSFTHRRHDQENELPEDDDNALQP